MYFFVNFSPAANGVGVQRSIQLSYRHTLLFFFGTFGGNFP